jgi:hypothetical protein
MGEINMLVAKLVDNNYMYDNISYANFGTPIEKVMLVLPINEDVSFNSMRFKEKVVLLEILEENIVNCKRNSYFKVNKATPVRNLNDDELSILRSAACKNPRCAYYYAYYVDQKPTNETRTAACKNPYYAFYYAKDVDQKPTNESRIVACKKSEYAYYYALYVDHKPTDETRSVSCKSPHFAYLYALYIDKNPTDETRTAACRCQEYAYRYAREVDKKPTPETKDAVSKDQYYKKEYERWEKSTCW